MTEDVCEREPLPENKKGSEDQINMKLVQPPVCTRTDMNGAACSSLGCYTSTSSSPARRRKHRRTRPGAGSLPLLHSALGSDTTGAPYHCDLLAALHPNHHLILLARPARRCDHDCYLATQTLSAHLEAGARCRVAQCR